MPARREADHADAMRIKAPLVRLAADEADRPLSILERTKRRLALHVTGTARTAVLENDSRHTQRVQPVRDFLPFDIPAEVVVSATGTDQHGRSRVFVVGW